MRMLLRLRNNMTGEERDLPLERWDESEMSLWTDGNCACDCSRADFFAAAGGESESVEQPCGSTVYTALYVQFPNGNRLPVDDEES